MMNRSTADEFSNHGSSEFTSPSIPEEIPTRRGAYGEENDQNDDVLQPNLSDDIVEENDNCNRIVCTNTKGSTDTRDPSTSILNPDTERSIEGCDDEQTFQKEDVSAIDFSALDWNKVFHFLANQLDATKSILFFNTLYGNTSNRGEINSSTKYKQVENDMKLRHGICDTVTLLLEQFKAWKEYAGKNAKHTVISMSLQDLNMNDTFDKFQSFMRDPPMLPPVCQDEHGVEEVSLWSADQKHNANSFSVVKPSQVNVKTCYYTIEQNNYCAETRKAPDGGVPENLDFLKWSCQAPYNCNRKIQKSEVDMESTDSKYQSREENLKYVTTGSRSVSFFQKHLSIASFRLLIKEFVNSKEYLRPDMYHILLSDTISMVMSETAKSADIVLSITYQDFLEADKLKTKKETIIVLYSNENRLVFGESAFSDLGFYAAHARKQVLGKLGKPNDNEDDVHNLFLDYDGKCINSKYFCSNEKNEAERGFVYVQDVEQTKEEVD